jgi:carboxypeptidase C (cathepsin A)
MFLRALDAAETDIKPLTELLVESSSQLKIDDAVIDYRAQAGTLVLKDDQGKDKGAIFYSSYFRKGVPSGERPITFCFNGGPGAASVWLNIGLAGPKKIAARDLDFLPPPYFLIDNTASVLDVTDLVFIDPIGTGLSTLAPCQDQKNVYGVEEDAALMAQFIQQFTVKMRRWDSPKYLMGESYGGLRAVLVADRLHDEGYYLNGLFLVSPVLDMQTITYNTGNDLPYILSLPTFALVAQYHQKALIAPSIDELGRFAIQEYAPALLAGDLLSVQEKERIAKELSQRIGISKELLLQNDLRLTTTKFRKMLLAEKDQLIGRFDARSLGAQISKNENASDYDPSLEAVMGAMTASFNQYVDKDLKWPEVKDYKPLVNLPSWNWGKGNQYANALGELKRVMIQNPRLKVLIAMGDYDLAAPLFSTEYSLHHALLPASALDRVNSVHYPAGHMFYFNKDHLVDFNVNFRLLLK